MNIDELVQLTTSKIEAVRVESDAAPMKKYMKDRFEYFGVKSPARKNVQRELKVYWKTLDNAQLFTYAEALWKLPQRELQYVALDALETRAKKLDASFLPRIEWFIITKSWWDTVDGLAPNIAGSIFYRDEEARMSWVEKWNNSENMWLNRSALLHQLRYKKDTNLELMFALIETHIGSKEFFINKASGWALRQASKFFPGDVREFIENHPNLSNLTKREGSKYI
ncbi:MAG: DNA alkylation repair protein [Bacteroidota bacterium]